MKRTAYKPAFPAIRVLLIGLTAAILVLYLAGLESSGMDVEALTAIIFQFGAYALAWALLVAKDSGPRLTIGNLGKLYACHCGAYLIFPSVLWFARSNINIPYGEYVTAAIGTQLIWLHGIYILAFFGAYTLTSRANTEVRNLSPDRIPSGFAATVACTGLLAFLLTQKMLSGGIAGLERSSTVSEIYQKSVEATRTGGTLLFLYQVGNRLRSFFCCLTGVFLGTEISRAKSQTERRLPVLILTVFASVALLAISGGGRMLLMITASAALVTADYLVGPLKWRYLAPLAVLAILVSEYVVYVRSNIDELKTPSAWMPTFVDYPDKFFEQAIMFGKEAVVVTDVHTTGVQWGPTHLVHSALMVIPRQLLPGKENWNTIAEYLRTMLLGSEVNTGAGLAGTAIGEGYITARTLGVLSVGLIGGLILGACQRLLLGGMRSRPRVWVIIPLAYLSANSIFLLRSDLNSLFDALVFGVIPLWMVLKFYFVSFSRKSRWNDALTMGRVLHRCRGGSEERRWSRKGAAYLCSSDVNHRA
jgi:hypothetical protein